MIISFDSAGIFFLTSAVSAVFPVTVFKLLSVNLIFSMQMSVSVFVLCIFLAGAAFTDLRVRKVRNIWVLAGFIPGLILLGYNFLWNALLIFLPGYFLFCLRLMGAGDLKVLMLITGYLGLWDGLWAVFAGLLIAAFYSVVLLVRNKDIRSRPAFFFAWVRQMIILGKITQDMTFSIDKKERTIPLAACLAAGTYLYVTVMVIVRIRGGF